jgi:thiol-disulfide isomerase/thioredoxin
MKSLHVLLIAILCVGLLAGCSKKEEPSPPPAASSAAAKIGDAAASLDGLTYVKGDPVTFEDGKVTVVEFWATWCPPCKTSIPHLTEVQKQYRDKGVTVIGISNESVATVKSFTKKMGEKMEYTVAVDGSGEVSKGYMDAYGQGGIPTAFIVDQSGKVAWVGHPMGDMEAALDKVLGETPDEVAIDGAAIKEKLEAAVKANSPAGQLGQKAAALEGLTYVKGEPVTFEDGKVTVVEFWATWCGPCRTSIPHLTEVQKQYKDKGVTVIGISSEAPDTVKPFIEKMGETMDYTVALDVNRKVNDAYMKAFNQRGIPTAFIVDGKGEVAWVGHPMGGMDEVLEQVIAGSFDPEAYAKAKAEREAAQRNIHTLYQDYNGAVLKGASIEETRPIAEKIIASNDPDALNALAWQILTMPGLDEAKRDTEIALKAATTANTQTHGENPMILDTYAMALFKNGKIGEAVDAQQKAIDLAAGNERMQADMMTRLEQFKEALGPVI